MIFTPTHSYGTGKTQISAANMLQAILVANKVGGQNRHRNIALIICGVYGIDCPWLWHLERIVEKYPVESFDNAEWIPTFITFYTDFINTIEAEILEATGTNLGIEGVTLK